MFKMTALVSFKTLACFLCLVFNQHVKGETTSASDTSQSTPPVHIEPSGLSCYFCEDMGDRCNDNQQYLDAIEGRNPLMTKNCTPPYDKMCITERYSKDGNTRSVIRDCSDGWTFSFKNGTYKRLDDLGTNNETACVYDLKDLVHVCLTKCNTTFCNGPQFHTANKADVKPETVFLQVVILIWTKLTV